MTLITEGYLTDRIGSRVTKLIQNQSKWCDSRRDGIFTLIPPTMRKTYPPEVHEQISYFLKYNGGKQIVKRYLAILNNPGYADSYRKPRSTKKR